MDVYIHMTACIHNNLFSTPQLVYPMQPRRAKIQHPCWRAFSETKTLYLSSLRHLIYFHYYYFHSRDLTEDMTMTTDMDTEMDIDASAAVTMASSMEIDSDMDDASHCNGNDARNDCDVDNINKGTRTVNVLVSDVPGCSGTILLRIGNVDTGVTAGLVVRSLSTSIFRISERCNTNINMEHLSYRLRCNGRMLTDASQIVSEVGASDAYVSVLVSRALPGGKGGFGANLRGAATANAKRSDNIGACRDLSGRRIRDVQLAQQQRDYSNNIKIKRPRGCGVPISSSPEDNNNNNNSSGNTIPRAQVDDGGNDNTAAELDADIEIDIDAVEDRMREREDEIKDDVMVGFMAARKRRKLNNKKSSINSSNITTPAAETNALTPM